MKPLTPKQAVKLKSGKKATSIPDVVIEVVNQLIVEKLHGETATVLQEDIIKRLLEKKYFKTRQEIFENKYLDFEDHYRKAGWKVFYDKPGYCESYEPVFKFTSCQH